MARMLTREAELVSEWILDTALYKNIPLPFLPQNAVKCYQMPPSSPCCRLGEDICKMIRYVCMFHIQVYVRHWRQHKTITHYFHNVQVDLFESYLMLPLEMYNLELIIKFILY